MKSLLVAAALTGVSLASTAFAYEPKSTAPQTLPAPRIVPESVVRPSGLPLSAAGEVVNVEFSLDANGQPRQIRVHSHDALLKRQLLQAFSQWRFDGITGVDVNNKRFVLPVQLNKES